MVAAGAVGGRRSKIAYRELYEKSIGEKGKLANDHIMFHCPMTDCTGSQRSFGIRLSDGIWNCFRCNRSGNAKQYAELMGEDVADWELGVVEVEQKVISSPLTNKRRRELFTKLFDTCFLHTEHKEQMLARGIDPRQAQMVSSQSDILDILLEYFDINTLVRGGLAYTNGIGGLVPRYCVSANRILIPYLDEENLVYYFVGYEKLGNRPPDVSIERWQTIKANFPKIAGPAGYPTTPYGHIPENAEYVVITEGQICALSAIQRGINTVGLQGVTNGHASIVKQCKDKRVRRVIILFDSQREGAEDISWCAEKLGRLFVQERIPVFRVELPLPEGRAKIDIDEFLLENTTEDFVEVLKGNRPYKIRGA